MSESSEESKALTIIFYSQSCQFVARPLIKHLQLLTTQRIAALNFLHSISQMPIKNHNLYMLFFAFAIIIFAGLVTAGFLIPYTILLFPACLLMLVVISLLIYYSTHVRNSTVKWEKGLQELMVYFPRHQISKDSTRHVGPRVFWLNCKGIQLRLEPKAIAEIHKNQDITIIEEKKSFLPKSKRAVPDGQPSLSQSIQMTAESVKVRKEKRVETNASSPQRSDLLNPPREVHKTEVQLSDAEILELIKSMPSTSQGIDSSRKNSGGNVINEDMAVLARDGVATILFESIESQRRVINNGGP